MLSSIPELVELRVLLALVLLELLLVRLLLVQDKLQDRLLEI